ncbi:methyltransferase domain-containing protein [Kocuria sp.]|uniref:methyltransferase domain-containing protein n=1 Tax=Kocuria sp. TaxID=1871328 RepID=UPI0026E08F18|nr:methyltransferase domain-containing protein [Kocuria sp.]MDO5619740.1 methyltransferase domain-containing protein [Kocuria sp.]
MQCKYHNRGLCHSCTLIDQPYSVQLAQKAAGVRDALETAGAEHEHVRWLEPVPSAQTGFRNKAKMVVAGTVDRPRLGILDPGGRGVDLRDCPLYPEAVGQALQSVAEFSARLKLLPYNVAKGRGELKHVLLTVSPDAELMLRFVLRSPRQVERIRNQLPWLHAELPGLRVVSVNLQPEHKAVLEGPEEILLTEQDSLRMRVNHVDLRLRSRSFFQTNTEVAAALYRLAARWAEQINPSRVLDLYCGVGGFALHLAGAARSVVGVEVSTEAVTAAREAADDLGLPESAVRFQAGDATTWDSQLGSTSGASNSGYDDAAADLIVVNPPRRGLGAPLARRLDRSAAQSMIYSSCNATTLARDVALMPSWRVVEGQVLDMFPHTGHYEVALRLQRK